MNSWIRFLPVLLGLLLGACAPLPTLKPDSAPAGSQAAAQLPTGSPTATPSPSPSPTTSPSPTQSPSPSPSPMPSPTPTLTPAPSPSPATAGKPATVSFLLPPALYGVVGREMTIRLENLVLATGDNYGCGASGPGELTGRIWRWTPDKAGVFPLTLRAGDKRLSTVVHVAQAQSGEGETRKCLFLGDSITEKGGYTGRLLGIAEGDGLKLTLLGSRGKAPNLTEGRAGWRAQFYIGSRSYNGVPNRFYNPSGKRFDFQYYMKSMKYTSVDRVCIALGTNDVFVYQTDKELNAEIKRVLKRIDTMVKSIRAYGKVVKIGIFITVPPTGKPETFLDDYADRQTLARYHRNQFLYTGALIDKYKDQETNGVWLVPVNASIDRQFIDGVHPYGKGHDQMAEAVWCWLKNLE